MAIQFDFTRALPRRRRRRRRMRAGSRSSGAAAPPERPPTGDAISSGRRPAVGGEPRDLGSSIDVDIGSAGAACARADVGRACMRTRPRRGAATMLTERLRATSHTWTDRRRMATSLDLSPLLVGSVEVSRAWQQSSASNLVTAQRHAGLCIAKLHADPSAHTSARAWLRRRS